MVKLNHVAIDVTKLKANTSNTNLVNQEEIKWIREIFKKRNINGQGRRQDLIHLS